MGIRYRLLVGALRVCLGDAFCVGAVFFGVGGSAWGGGEDFDPERDFAFVVGGREYDSFQMDERSLGGVE